MIKNQDIAISPSLLDPGFSGEKVGRLHKAPFIAGWKRCLLPLLALGWMTGAWGATLSDPTAPPPAWLAEHPPVPGVADLAVTPGVQWMLIGKTRKFAIIDGQLVKPGDSYNGSKVVAIKQGKVVLQDASKSLKLTPDVEKKVIKPTPLKKKRSAASKRKKLVNGNGGNQ